MALPSSSGETSGFLVTILDPADLHLERKVPPGSQQSRADWGLLWAPQGERELLRVSTNPGPAASPKSLTGNGSRGPRPPPAGRVRACRRSSCLKGGWHYWFCCPALQPALSSPAHLASECRARWAPVLTPGGLLTWGPHPHPLLRAQCSYVYLFPLWALAATVLAAFQ